MAGRGPAPKPPELRQRTNARLAGRRLPTEEQAGSHHVPELPVRSDGEWHPMAVEWWATAWRSPMASEWLASDMRGGLYRLVDLWHAWWSAPTSALRMEIAKELRLQEVGFGLSPMDRKRLEWEVEKGEAADPVPEERRQTVGAPKAGSDPRKVLKLG